MVKDGLGWFSMVQDGLGQQDCLGWLNMVWMIKDGIRWFIIAQNGKLKFSNPHFFAT